MSQALTAMSGRALQDLRKGPTVEFKYNINNQDNDAEAKILYAAYPLNIVAAFAPNLAGNAVDVNLNNPTQGTKKSITVVGRFSHIWRSIFEWMGNSCNGRGLQALRVTDSHVYAHLYLVRMYANRIGCPYLVGEVTQRMANIERAQIHSEDVRLLWELSAAGEEIRVFLVEHIGIRFWNKTLHPVGPYLVLRKEISEFGNAINDFCDEKSRMAREAREAKRQELEAARAAEEAKRTTIVLQREVTRKAAHGRPAYAAVDLADIGITKKTFAPRGY